MATEREHNIPAKGLASEGVFPPIQDRRELRYERDPELARLMADEEVDLRENAAWLRESSRTANAAGEIVTARKLANAAKAKVTEARRRSRVLQANFRSTSDSLLEQWTDVVTAIGIQRGSTRDGIELEQAGHAETDSFSELVTRRTLSRLSRVFMIGDPTPVEGEPETIPLTIGDKKSNKMSVASVRSMPGTADLQIVEGKREEPILPELRGRPNVIAVRKTPNPALVRRPSL